MLKKHFKKFPELSEAAIFFHDCDFIFTKYFMFNLNVEYGLAEGEDEQSYGGGFRWQF